MDAPQLERIYRAEAPRITAALAMPLTIGKRQVPMSASVGLSLYPDNASDVDTLVKQADAAMYKAKREGRNRYGSGSPTVTRGSVSRAGSTSSGTRPKSTRPRGGGSA